MNLVDNYINQVEDYLASGTDKDVLQELESAIYDVIEEKEESLGHSLKDNDIADILRKFGAPMEVAARYAPQQYLIGPTLFPNFRHGLKVAFAIIVVFHLIRVLFGFAANDDTSFNIFRLFSRILYSCFWGFSWLVIIFATLEYYGGKLPTFSTWDPLKRSNTRQSASDRDNAVTNVISDVLMLFIWNYWFSQTVDSTSTIGELSITFSDIFVTLYWPVNFLLVASVALYSWQILNRSWSKTAIIFALVIDIVSMIILILFLADADQLTFTGAGDGIFAERIAEHANTVFKVTLAIILAFIAWDGWKHWQVWRKFKD